MSSTHQLFSDFYTRNPALFGDLNERAIVAVEVASDQEVEIFRRHGDSVTTERRPLLLFALLTDPEVLEGFQEPYEIEELQGSFPLRFLVKLRSLRAQDKLKKHLKKKVSADPHQRPDTRYFMLNDPVEQFLTLTGINYFIGMQFSDLRRLQLDIETYITAGFEFPNPQREGDRIVVIAIRDSTGFECVLSGRDMDEGSMLREMVRIIRERDPDVIEGHNLMRFDLEYINARARLHGVSLALGRGGQVIEARPSRLQIGERAISYTRYHIYGRNIIDTWMLSQLYDISSRELEGFGLKELAQHFGLAPRERTYLDPARVSHYFDHEPELLHRYALDDVRETGALAELLSGSYFVQAQIFPYSYQSVVVRGNATKVDALLLRAYLKARHSIPLPQEPTPVTGGYTEIRRVGVARNVLHCDVTSLYPSLMLHFRHGPKNDRLDIFLTLLRDLTDLRVKAKQLARELTGTQYHFVQALQQTFKILINSFYGYLGFTLGHFNDFEQANLVTARGRELVRRLVDELEKRGAQVIEVDTDGIYFVAPFPLDDVQAEARLLEQLSSLMPGGVRLEIDGRYPSMFSYKMKNYVLLDDKGEITVRGSSLRSRGIERFQRQLMEELFRCFLEGRYNEIEAIFESYRSKLIRYELDIRELAKTETLTDSPQVYLDKVGAKRRNVSAAYELAIKSGRPYGPGDQVSYYVAGKGARVKVAKAARLVSDYNPEQPDVNIEYYLAKLDDLYQRFKPYIDNPELSPASSVEQTGADREGDLFVSQDE